MNKKILVSLAVIGVVTAIAIGGTIAYFNDTEISNGNVFIAGNLDLKVDDNCTYNGQPVQECNWQEADLTNQLFFNYDDVKPGDWGENTVSLHIHDNPAWVCAQISNLKNYENGCNNPETKTGDTTCDNPGEGQGELQNALLFTMWRDANCDNQLDQGETVLVDNKPAQNGYWSIADKNTGTGPITDACIGIKWNIPADTGNIIQGDGLFGNISFSAVQSRNNNEFLCPVFTPESESLLLFEHYNTGDNDVNSVFDPKWEAQTFTPQISHIIKKVKVKIYRLNFPGIVTVGIRATDAEGKPIGADLVSGTIDGNTFTTDSSGAWYDIDFGSETTLSSGVKYAIVLGNSASGWARWMVNTNSNYEGGTSLTSFDNGNTWVFCDGGFGVGGTYDTLFEEWGIPVSEGIVQDNFNSYTNGSIIGQGNWESYVNGENFIVQETTIFEGYKSLYNNSIADSVIGKMGIPLASGKQVFYVRTENRSNWGFYLDGNVQVRVSKGLWASGAPGLAFASVTFKKNGNVAYYDSVGDVYQNFATYNDNEWTLLEIEWRPSEARYRVKDGVWTDWHIFRNSASFTNFDYVGFDFNLSAGSGGGVYFDTLY